MLQDQNSGLAQNDQIQQIQGIQGIKYQRIKNFEFRIYIYAVIGRCEKI